MASKQVVVHAVIRTLEVLLEAEDKQVKLFAHFRHMEAFIRADMAMEEIKKLQGEIAVIGLKALKLGCKEEEIKALLYK